MRIKQKLLHSPNYTYTRTLNRKEYKIDLYSEPCHCINVINVTDNIKQCYPLSYEMYKEYVNSYLYTLDSRDCSEYCQKQMHKYLKKHETDLAIFYNNASKGEGK